MAKYEELKNKIDEEIKSIKEHELKLNELKEEIDKAEQEEKCSNKMLFEIGEDYYCISNFGEIIHDEWSNDEVDFWRFNQANIFKNKEDAKDKLFQLKVEAKAREFRRINNCDVDKEDLRNINNRKYYIYYNLVRGITIGTYSVNIEPTKLGYFNSEEMANRFTKENEEDLIKYFKIKMGV